MLLCIDAGNTRLKSAVWSDGAWQARTALAHADWEQWVAWLPAGIRQVVACNVAGEQCAARLERLAGERGWPLHWLTASAEHAGVRNGYAQPTQLGADRWAALLGARELQVSRDALRRPLLIVLAGTATTIDALSTDGWFRGGVILPGLALMRQSLAKGTAQLPEAQGPAAAWPADTHAAIVSGALEATAGAIDRRYARLHLDTGVAPVILVAGGAAAALTDALTLPLERTPDIVLEGLRRHADLLRPA